MVYVPTKKYISNRQMGRLTASLTPFMNHKGSCFSREVTRLAYAKHSDVEHVELVGYAVFSYGDHFPIYYYDHDIKKWFGNKDKYSMTTSRHQSCAWPEGFDREHISWVDTRTLQDLVDKGFVRHIGERIAG
jgi:hypothetical protein